eukprot:TRINITY_DN5654_c0_g1_i1.p1 TRINITY_DN5654_c0_g1~~TRINITY_DN5654_c0_g1_i1.p1  ORF type:complete len:418 (+),score=68.95 TRINITY_DN5654_c0_g1_i1:105-1256(+)
MAMPDIKGYILHAQLGSGASGIVYRASLAPRVPSDDSSNVNEEEPQEERAVKVYDPQRGEQHFRKEREFLEAVNGHPNVAALVASFEGERNVLVMPLYRGPDLDTLVRRLGPPGEEAAKAIFQDVLAATQHVHGRGVLHRDIKPDNILIDGDGRAVLVDFDVSCYISDTSDPDFQRAGTPGYVAPEVIMRRPYREASDLFSLGCTLYFMFKKRPPFHTKPHSKEAVFRKTVVCKYPFDVCFDDVSEACKGMISALVRRTSARRLTCEQALQHAWLTAGASSEPTSTRNAEASGAEGPSTGSFSAANGSQAGSGSFGPAFDSMAEEVSFASTGQLEDRRPTVEQPSAQSTEGAARATHVVVPQRPSGNPARPVSSVRAARVQFR